MQSSTYTADAHTQPDGRRRVYEQHVDVLGRSHKSSYWAPAGWTSVEMDARLADRAARIDAMLVDVETRELLDDVTKPLVFNFTTAQNFISAVREAWRERDKEELARLAYWLWTRVQNGDLTETQIRNAFGMNPAEWNAFRDNKLVPLKNAWESVQLAAGE